MSKNIIRLVIIFTLIFSGFSLSACNTETQETQEAQEETVSAVDKAMMEIYRKKHFDSKDLPYNSVCYAVRDKVTGVVYLFWYTKNGKNSVGGVTPLLQSDGTPIVIADSIS